MLHLDPHILELLTDLTKNNFSEISGIHILSISQSDGTIIVAVFKVSTGCRYVQKTRRYTLCSEHSRPSLTGACVVAVDDVKPVASLFDSPITLSQNVLKLIEPVPSKS